jgi:hypothetical protein
MQIWETLLGSATETDLLRLGEALAVGAVPRTAMGVLQALLCGPGRPGLAPELDQLDVPISGIPRRTSHRLRRRSSV